METRDDIKGKAKRKFCKAWLYNERYKDWIREVSHDNTLYYCNVCNKSFPCTLRVSKHMDSACHVNNIKENSITQCNPTNPKKSHRQFRPQWQDNKDCKSWLREVPDDKFSVYCSVCDRKIIGHLAKIHRHAESNLHKNKCRESDIEANK